MESKALTTKEIIAALAEKFPACFSVDGQAKPLKVGIFQDIAETLTEEDAISKTRLRQALRHYTSSWRYLKSVKQGAFRVDLAGEQVAEIDQEQAEYAAKTLKESQEKFGYKKNAKSEKGEKPATNKHKGSKKADTNKQQKFKNIKSTKRAAKQEQANIELKPAEQSTIKVGANVKVRFGNAPMDAVITEVDGNDVQVQLSSGMVVKTQAEKIFS